MATTTKKTTTAKPAAKKTTTAKPAAKKTMTTAKKAAPVKKTTTAKPAAKPAPVKTAVELSVTGNKKIGTLMKEFNKQFPYLRLKICYSYARQAVAKGESISGIDPDKTLASVRRADSGGDISISGNKKIKSLEKEFDTVFGLYVQPSPPSTRSAKPTGAKKVNGNNNATGKYGKGRHTAIPRPRGRGIAVQ